MVDHKGSCPEPRDLVSQALDLLLTQYRESPNLIALAEAFLLEAAEAAEVVCSIPSYFDLDTALGEQLTFIGKRMGWPRCHCVCDYSAPVFGFDCDTYEGPFEVEGFCGEGTWLACASAGRADICLNDDEVYRGYLKARRYQFMRLFDRRSLEEALRHLWGAQAIIISSGHGRVVLAPRRDLTESETAQLQLVGRVLPVAPGIRVAAHFGAEAVFGFGEGWHGFCLSEEEPITDTSGEPITTTSDETIDAGAGGSAVWLCPEELNPYECVT